MRIPSITLAVGPMVLLAACALTPDEPPVAHPVATSPVVIVPPISQEEELPKRSTAVLILPAPVKHVSAHANSSAPNARQSAAVRKLEAAPKLADQSSAPMAELSALPPSERANAAPKMRQGPAWLAACKHRQQQGDVIMCDADTLLVEPSDKVMVYVRDAKYSRKLESGHAILLRQSLPRLYRLFVLE